MCLVLWQECGGVFRLELSLILTLGNAHRAARHIRATGNNWWSTVWIAWWSTSTRGSIRDPALSIPRKGKRLSIYDSLVVLASLDGASPVGVRNKPILLNSFVLGIFLLGFLLPIHGFLALHFNTRLVFWLRAFVNSMFAIAIPVFG
jgi:hypothetical protein